MASETLIQKRAVTTAKTLKPIEKSELKNATTKTHYPFVTKVQIRKVTRSALMPMETEEDKRRSGEIRCVKPTNFEYKNPPVSRASSLNSLNVNEKLSKDREEMDELRKRRCKKLGDQVLQTLSKNEHLCLYRPILTTKDGEVQLRLVRELKGHLKEVSQQTLSGQRIKSKPTLHSRLTKGELVFGVKNWKSLNRSRASLLNVGY